ncbi:hypothetical protein BACDOR_04280 [Phocaeicola dorei DSM 17855]|uniref:Uncharacterized protein n=1 Tax=Phocaeicola dorei DSM 17855 TaxID=483217 RepID=B6W3Y5_9BACT|nr:hypothetical protein BACDOR_04280 [Phocaeicola dorei DSM 17855]
MIGYTYQADFSNFCNLSLALRFLFLTTYFLFLFCNVIVFNNFSIIVS